MTESKPDQSEHTGGEPDTTTQPVSEDAGAARPNGESASSVEHGSPSNGHPSDGPPRLPPPWERVPAESSSGLSSDRAPDRAEAWTSSDATVTDYGGQSGSREASEAADVDYAAVPDTPIGRGVPDLGDARTVGVDPRVGAGIGGLGAGFGSGSGSSSGSGGASGSASGPSAGAVSTPGGFPAGWPRNRRPRQANLQLKRLDPWSVLKIALVLSVVLYLVWMVAVGVLYGAMDGIGVWERLNGQYADLVAEHAGDKLISAGRIFGFAAVVGAVNSLLVAVAFSVSAFIYNVSADLVGGIEVTLSERD